MVGRLVRDPEVVTTDSGKQVSHVTIAIPRSFKSSNGEYETDFISCVLWDAVAKNTAEYCKQGNIIGVKGRLQSRVVEQDDKTKKYYTDVIAEKVTFLSSNKDDGESDENPEENA